MFKLLAVALLISICGCVTQNHSIISTPIYLDKEPTPVPTQNYWTVTPQDVPKVIVGAKFYIVKKGDCLWTIAKKKSIYNDAFMWPVLFKDNRDVIKNQDLIYKYQALKVRSKISNVESALAKTIASKTPKYHKHK